MNRHAIKHFPNLVIAEADWPDNECSGSCHDYTPTTSDGDSVGVRGRDDVIGLIDCTAGCDHN
ncbi:hypothetical protein PGTUg99_028765 [Puccinia graminis f. sp. tritici]|uniref:Uncharacterized protein n=1 Tax=Puccinia graminis f. sp. tritici TaxID=56615 RepID=A0A5B0RG28_PUCGR|nr:hypothetical protein PGTUg99_028765 [Puccinia graminis f. sp. tritici]